MDELLALKKKGWSHKRLAGHFGVSDRTIKRRFAAIAPNTNIMSVLKLLEKAAASIPPGTCRNEIRRLQKDIRARHPVSEKDKKNQILSAVESGARAVVEIAAECFLPRAETETLLREMVAENLIAERLPEGLHRRGRRMKLQYFLSSIVP